MNAKQLPIVNCDGCGACCLHFGHPMFFRSEGGRGPFEPQYYKLPDHLREEYDNYMAEMDGDDSGEPCIWLDFETRKCRHYEHRPEVCRSFEVGGEDCIRLRQQAMVQLSLTD